MCRRRRRDATQAAAVDIRRGHLEQRGRTLGKRRRTCSRRRHHRCRRRCQQHWQWQWQGSHKTVGRVRGRRVHGEVARAAQLMAPEKVRTLRVEQQGYLWGSAGAVMSSLLASSAVVGTRRGGHAPSSESEQRGYLWLLEQRGYLSLLESEGTSH